MLPRSTFPIRSLPEPVESTRSLSRVFTAIHAQASAVNVQCSRCRERGRVNSMLLGKGKRPPFLCGVCRAA
jgi:hypothetical protein